MNGSATRLATARIARPADGGSAVEASLRLGPCAKALGGAGQSCIFCQRADGSLNKVFLENSTCYARWDNFPAADGHLEVVPKRHVTSFFELMPREVQDVYELLLRARTLLSEKCHPDGYTIGINEGRAAGRTIDHLHVHLIPRYNGDVPDPRGGIRHVVPGTNPDLWA